MDGTIMTADPHELLDLEPLFSSFKLNAIELPNRFVMPAMQRMWCENGRPLPRLAEYYRSRVEGGVGLLISESCAVDHESATQVPLFAWLNESTLDAWAVCADAVKSAGGHMLMQLWHEGAKRKEGGDGPYAQYPTLSPSGLAHAAKPNGRAATSEDLQAICEAFVRSAKMAQQLGVDGIEVHAAHGFLLDQFLWAETNRRADGYGGEDIVQRARFPAEIVAAIRRAVGPEFVISFRFSQWKDADYDAKVAETPQELATLLGVLRDAGVDIFHASARRFWEAAWPDSPLGIAGWTKSLTDAAVIVVGSVGLDTDVMDNFYGAEAKQTGESGLRELLRRFNGGEFDLVSVGRSLIGDGEWVRKVREGRLSDIRSFTRRDLIGDLIIERPVG
jgi:2,4-dienoyl-CoA reductase-like NADH-dependent reductase (Old Yellow Enzyme family)